MKQNLNLNLGQQLSMTPQLQQAIRLLQLNSLELQQEIQQTLESNPLLEMDDAPQENSVDESLAENSISEEHIINDSLKESLPIQDDWSSPYTALDQPATDVWEQKNHAPSKTLKEHLLEQLEWVQLSESDTWMTHLILDSLDARGFLSDSLEHLLDLTQTKYPETESEELLVNLRRIQQLDPIGIAALDLKDSLLIQLKPKETSQPEIYALAYKMIEQKLEWLGNRDYARLKRHFKISDEILGETITLIQTLNPRPASTLSDDPIEYITPDVYVFQHNEEWQIELNPQLSRKLSVNQLYAGMIKQAQPDEKEYLKTHLQEAKWFIKSLHNRNDTLLKVARAIIKRQRAFLDYGEVGMKAMILKDIAEDIDMHESTVSRVTSQKYMHTPRGIFELKHFFSRQMSTSDGGNCSSTAIRALLQKLIENEPPQKPLSDSKLCQLLKEEGINVARRTIAKYREELNIPPSNVRKQIS